MVLLRFGRMADQAALALAPTEGPRARPAVRPADAADRRVAGAPCRRAGAAARAAGRPGRPRCCWPLPTGAAWAGCWKGRGFPPAACSGELRVRGLLGGLAAGPCGPGSDDESDDLSTTMAALDRALRRRNRPRRLAGRPRAAHRGSVADPARAGRAGRRAASEPALHAAGDGAPGSAPAQAGSGLRQWHRSRPWRQTAALPSRDNPIAQAMAQARSAAEDFTKLFGETEAAGGAGHGGVASRPTGATWRRCRRANRIALEGAQAVARRHMEIMQQTMAELTETMRTLASADAPQAKAAKQAEMLKQAYRARGGAHDQELSDLIQRSQQRGAGAAQPPLRRGDGRGEGADGEGEAGGLRAATAAAPRPARRRCGSGCGCRCAVPRCVCARPCSASASSRCR